MKKFFSFFAIAIMVLCLTGCGTEEKEQSSNNKSNTDSSYTFTSLENDLKSLDSNLEVNKKSAEMVGAKEGYGYKLNACTIEVYQFDTNSDSYKTALKNQELNLESLGMKLSATVDKGIAYIVDEDNSNCDNAIQYVNKLMK